MEQDTNNENSLKPQSLTSSKTNSYEGGGLSGMHSGSSVASKIAGTFPRGLFNSLSQLVSTELLRVEGFDFDILLNLNLKGATLTVSENPPQTKYCASHLRIMLLWSGSCTCTFASGFLGDSAIFVSEVYVWIQKYCFFVFVSVFELLFLDISLNLFLRTGSSPSVVWYF